MSLVFFTLSITVGTGLGTLIFLFPTEVVGNMEKQLQSLIETLQETKAQSESSTFAKSAVDNRIA